MAGSFYPEKFSTPFLAYYAERFPTVEINYTFYRMPTEKLLVGWQLERPITSPLHSRPRAASRTTPSSSGVKSSCRRSRAPRERGETCLLLFQLPPTLKKDTARLSAFLDTLPAKAPAAFEFRHPSWFDEEVYRLLRDRGKTLCVADSEKLETPLELTSDIAYFRLRDEGYQPRDIEAWATRFRSCRAFEKRLCTSSTKSRGLGRSLHSG
jgi:uncharacterized protein YecE (DUF72 family)